MVLSRVIKLILVLLASLYFYMMPYFFKNIAKLRGPFISLEITTRTYQPDFSYLYFSLSYLKASSKEEC